jgi:signal peptidase I
MASLQDTFFEKHSYHKIAILFLQKGETVQIPLSGHCMKPLLSENDLVTIQPMKAENIKCGDVAVFQIHGELKAHRFLRFKIIDENTYLITKGDRRLHCDSPVPSENLLGKITQVKKGNKIVDYRSPKWDKINYLLGKLSPYLSYIEYPFIRSRRLFAICMKYALGEKYTARIKKMLTSDESW